MRRVSTQYNTELDVQSCETLRKRVAMDDFDDRLAEEVRKHRRLYDNACPSRKNSKATIATWKAVGNAVKEDPTVCMRRWKAIRDKFVRLKKRIKTNVVPPGSEETEVDVHVIHSKLSWLSEHVSHRNIATKTEVQSRPKRESSNLHGSVTDMEQSSEAMPSEAEECDELDECRPPTQMFKQIDSKGKIENTEMPVSVKRFEVLENYMERHNQEDAYDRYTQTVADFMRGLSRRRCVVFKKRLNDLMYEMDLEELDDFSQS